jgi:arylsulfatase
MTDQQRHDQVGHASAGHFETPNLDGLADAGTVFEQAYSGAVVCVPARLSLLTGLGAHRVPIEPGTGIHLAQGSWTVARALRSAGYQTALVGKMHFSPVNGDYGFDTLRTCEHLFPTDFEPDGTVHPEAADDYHRWLTDQGVRDWRAQRRGHRDPDQPKAPLFPYDEALHPTSWVAREALDVLDRRDPQRPLLLVVSFPHPHEPHNPPQPYESMYDPADSFLPDEGLEVNDGLPDEFRHDLNHPPGPWAAARVPSASWLAGSLAVTRGLVRQIDDAMGPILDRLDLGRTVVAFTSDHGDYAGHRGLIRKMPWMAFEDLARVPLVIAAPDGAAGQRHAEVVQNSDLALTLLDYAGVATDPEPFGSVDLRPVLRGDPAAADPDRAVVLSPSLPWSGIRRGRYKYLGRRNPYFPVRALFDLVEDPGETCNLAEHPDHVAAADELERLLDLELARPIPEFAHVPADRQASPAG